MDKTYLLDLISGLEQELIRLGYTKGSMTFYRRRWNQLMAYEKTGVNAITRNSLAWISSKSSSGSHRKFSQGHCLRQKHRRSV